MGGRRKGKKGNEYEVVYFGQDAADALTETTWMAKDPLMKMTWIDQADKKKFDAFGNKIVIKKAAVKIPKAELKEIKKQVAALRKQGQEVYTDEEVEKAGYTID